MLVRNCWCIAFSVELDVLWRNDSLQPQSPWMCQLSWQNRRWECWSDLKAVWHPAWQKAHRCLIFFPHLRNPISCLVRFGWGRHDCFPSLDSPVPMCFSCWECWEFDRVCLLHGSGKAHWVPCQKCVSSFWWIVHLHQQGHHHHHLYVEDHLHFVSPITAITVSTFSPLRAQPGGPPPPRPGGPKGLRSFPPLPSLSSGGPPAPSPPAPPMVTVLRCYNTWNVGAYWWNQIRGECNCGCCGST